MGVLEFRDSRECEHLRSSELFRADVPRTLPHLCRDYLNHARSIGPHRHHINLLSALIFAACTRVLGRPTSRWIVSFGERGSERGGIRCRSVFFTDLHRALDALGSYTESADVASEGDAHEIKEHVMSKLIELGTVSRETKDFQPKGAADGASECYVDEHGHLIKNRVEFDTEGELYL